MINYKSTVTHLSSYPTITITPLMLMKNSLNCIFFYGIFILSF